MSSLTRFFHPWVNATLTGLAVLTALAWITSDVEARHQAGKLEHELCEARLEPLPPSFPSHG
ncbi:MAG: hypothetical protein HY614_02270 [Candidatus Rokubacteria bacterium]|nr:hypothetical protein [Candidatus Rokubacteria bacterium]